MEELITSLLVCINCCLSRGLAARGDWGLCLGSRRIVPPSLSELAHSVSTVLMVVGGASTDDDLGGASTDGPVRNNTSVMVSKSDNIWERKRLAMGEYLFRLRGDCRMELE